MTKLGTDLRLAALGAAAGLFSVSVFLLIARVDAYYAYMAQGDDLSYGPVESLWWLPALTWHVLLSIVASFLAHRYLTAFNRSPFILWQAIGLTVLVGWVLSFSVALGIDCVMRGNLNAFEEELRRIKPGFFAKYISAAFATNVLYGWVIQASSRQYEQRVLVDEQPWEFTQADTD